MKPLILAAIGLSVAVLVPWASRGQAPAHPVAEVTEVEYQVLSAYLAGAFTGDKGEHRVGSHAPKIVIANVTESDRDDSEIEGDDGKPMSWKQTSKYLHKEASTLQTAALNSFRDANPHPAPFRPSFRLPVAYELVDKTEIDAISRRVVGGQTITRNIRIPRDFCACRASASALMGNRPCFMRATGAAENAGQALRGNGKG